MFQFVTPSVTACEGSGGWRVPALRAITSATHRVPGRIHALPAGSELEPWRHLATAPIPPEAMRVFAWPGAGRPPALRQRGAISLLLAAAVMGGSNQATHRRERQSPGLGSIDLYNKARSMGPRAFACSAVVPSQGGRAQLRVWFWLGNGLIASDQRVFSCGRSVWRWHLGPGVNWGFSILRGT